MRVYEDKDRFAYFTTKRLTSGFCTPAVAGLGSVFRALGLDDTDLYSAPVIAMTLAAEVLDLRLSALSVGATSEDDLRRILEGDATMEHVARRFAAERKLAMQGASADPVRRRAVELATQLEDAWMPAGAESRANQYLKTEVQAAQYARGGGVRGTGGGWSGGDWGGHDWSGGVNSGPKHQGKNSRGSRGGGGSGGGAPAVAAPAPAKEAAAKAQ